MKKYSRRNPPVASFSLPPPGARPFGGIPLDGYREPRAVFHLSRDNKLTVYGYDLELPAGEPTVETFNLNAGKNALELDFPGGIVSFELEKATQKERLG